MALGANSLMFRMPSGIPGDISRRAQSIVEPVVLDGANPFSTYGLFGKLLAGKFVPLAAADTVDKIYAVLVRPYPTQTANADGSGVSLGKIGDALRFGFMTVKCNAGVPALGGQVYVRVATPTTPKPLGGVEALFDSTVSGVAGANTGNGVLSAMSSTDKAKAGAYKLTMSAATVFNVSDPDGVRLKDGATGVAYTAGGLTFTLTAGGTAFVVNDSFTITNAPNTVALPRSTFKDAGDAAGNVEIETNIGKQ